MTARPAIAPARKAQALAMIRAGAPFAAIAAELGVSQATLSRLALANGVHRNRDRDRRATR